MKQVIDYENKVCVVTGASSGMGKAVAELLVNLGAKVYALDVNPCPVEGVEKSFICNLADKNSIDEAFSVIPEEIDAYFGVAGLSGAKTPWLVTMNVNFTANKYITETYLENRMHEGSAILYTSSTSGANWKLYPEETISAAEAEGWEATEQAYKEMAPEQVLQMLSYLISKRCVCQYACRKAVELGKRGIRVNTALPGSTATGMKAEFEKMAGGNEALLKEAGVAGRLAESREMAEPMVFLNSNMASFVSGSEFAVDYADTCLKVLKMKEDREAVSIAMIKQMLAQRQ